MTKYFELVPGYESLATVYDNAIEQASEGKGKERHASEGEAYEDQVICEVARRVGLGYPLGQAVKKIYESQRLIPQLGVQELLGALNYVAAAVIVMQERMEEEGRRFREGFASSKTEDGCCQNGKDHANLLSFEEQAKTFARENPPEEPEDREFKPDDKVQARLGDGVWRDAVVTGKEITCGKLYYTVKVHDFNGYYSLQADDVRPAPKAEGCEYKKGDKVQCRVTLPSVSDRIWVDGEYVRYEKGRSRPHVVFTRATLELVSDEDIRPAPKAEGVEELVQKDAPQTPEETCQRIVDNNPSIYPRKPTGEELAEMAEEDAHE